MLLGLLVTTASVRAGAAVDDWTTFAHDQERTAFQRQPTGIDATNVGSLGLRWAVPLGEEVYSSPIVANGHVFIATGKGNVYALDPRDGSTAWKTNVGNMVRMTPALAGGLLFVGTYGKYGTKESGPSGASMEALDEKSGRIVWKTPLPGVVRSAPVIANGTVYEGIAGGDAAVGCITGRIVSLDARTGKILPPVWYTSSKPRNGGGIWSPLSYDGSALYFGTGNTCDDTGDQNSIVALRAKTLTKLWRTEANSKEGSDEDVGGGVRIQGARVYAEGKNGMLYALDRTTGKKLWMRDLQPDARGGGGFGTPAGDGTMLIVNSGDGSSRAPGARTTAIAFDLDGNQKYIIPQKVASSPSQSASFLPGIGFINVDRSIQAFDAATGKTLWSYASKDGFYASPAIVPSGIYDADLSGNVYAFALAKAGQTAQANLSTVDHDKPVIAPSGPSKRSLAIAAVAVVALGLSAASLIRRRKS